MIRVFGRKKEAVDLLRVFRYRYIERNTYQLKRVLSNFIKKYHYDPL